MKGRTPGSVPLVLAGLALAAMGLAALAARHELPWVDEGVFSSPAYNLAHHGFLGTTVSPEQSSRGGATLLRLNQRTYWVFPGYLVAQAGWIRLAGSGLFTIRAFSILWIPLVLVATYAIALHLTGRRDVALAAPALLGTQVVFSSYAAFARPDLMCLALGLGGLAVHLAWRERALARALAAANLLVALSGVVHPNGLLHFLNLWLVVVWLDRPRLGGRDLGAAAAPYALLALLWGAYILQDWEAFRAQIAVVTTEYDRVARTWNPLALVAAEVRERYLSHLGYRSAHRAAPLMSAFFLASAAGIAYLALVRRLGAYRLPIALLALTFATQCVFNTKLGYYLVHIMPWYALVLAAALAEVPSRRVAGWSLAAVCILGAALGVAKPLLGSYRTKEGEMLAFLRPRIGERARVHGSAGLIYGLEFERSLCNDVLLGARSGERADFVVVDPYYRSEWTRMARSHPALAREVDRILAGYEPVFDNGTYQVYRRR